MPKKSGAASAAGWRTPRTPSPPAPPLPQRSHAHIHATESRAARQGERRLSCDTQDTVKRPKYPDGESAVAVGPWSHTLTQPRIRPTVSQPCGTRAPDAHNPIRVPICPVSPDATSPLPPLPLPLTHPRWRRATSAAPPAPLKGRGAQLDGARLLAGAVRPRLRESLLDGLRRRRDGEGAAQPADGAARLEVGRRHALHERLVELDLEAGRQIAVLAPADGPQRHLGRRNDALCSGSLLPGGERAPARGAAWESAGAPRGGTPTREFSVLVRG